MSRTNMFFAGALLSFIVALPISASAVPTGEAKIVPQGNRCVRISTAGVDHGQATAQKFADNLLAADIETFKMKKGLNSVSIKRRYKKCNFHLWFFGKEYNCTSLAVVCW